MTAYMPLNGVPATGNPWLLDEVLRQTWGFDGWVVSDANAVRSLQTHGFAKDLTEAGIFGLNAGCDMEMAIADPAYAHLPSAVENGQVAESALDASVRRVLETKLRLGLFDEPFVDEERAQAVLNDPAHREACNVRKPHPRCVSREFCAARHN
jgi:beta-glucosidase